MTSPSPATSPITSLTLIDQASSTASTITVPACQPGDFLVFMDRATNASGAAPGRVTPEDWNVLFDLALSTVRLTAHCKLAEASDSGAVLTGMDGSTSEAKRVLVYRADVPITSYNIRYLDSVPPTNGDPTDLTMPASASRLPALALALYYSSGTVDPRTFTIGGVDARVSEVAGGAGTFSAAWKFFDALIGDITVGMADEGNTNTLCAVIFTFFAASSVVFAANLPSAPGVIAIYEVDQRNDDAPAADPLTEIDRTKFHSGLEYIATVLELTNTHSINATESDRLETFVVGSHGQAGIPLVFGFIPGWGPGGADLPLVGSVPVFVNSDGNMILVTLGVDATQVYLEVQRTRPTLGGGISLPVRVHVTNFILE